MKHLKYDICVFEKLNKDYPYIIQEMLKDDFFIIQDKIYDFFYEVTYFNKIVGFICGSINDNNIVCELAYIIPKYRKLGLFCSCLKSLDNIYNSDLVLFLPNHFVMLSLVHNNLAIRYGDLIISKYCLCFDRQDNGKRVYSFLYDISNFCIVSLSECIVSPLLDVDLYSSNINRIIDMEYFYNVRDNLLKLF